LFEYERSQPKLSRTHGGSEPSERGPATQLEDSEPGHRRVPRHEVLGEDERPVPHGEPRAEPRIRRFAPDDGRPVNGELAAREVELELAPGEEQRLSRRRRVEVGVAPVAELL
jgi:hypothetical protein